MVRERERERERELEGERHAAWPESIDQVITHCLLIIDYLTALSLSLN